MSQVLPAAPSPVRVRFPVRILQTYALLLLIIPSNTTLGPVGAAGFPAGLLGVLAMFLYTGWVLFGYHDPTRHRYPTRIAFTGLWLISLASYIACQFRVRSAIESNGADRWLLFLAGMTGIALVAAEGLRTREEIVSVLRAVVLGGAVCGFVAALQFWVGFDLAGIIGGSIPGFTFNGSLGGIQGRGALNRVPGTTLHPIELGAVTAIILPLALTLALTDRGRPLMHRVIPLMLIAVCIPVSVSRSAILAFGVAFLVMLVQLDARRRAGAMAAAPFLLVVVFLMIPGLIKTLSSFFLNAGTDTSVSTRTDDYPLVESLVTQRPWFGQGGGTYLPADLLTILDNTYLKWVVEFGLVGLVVMIVFYMALPVMTAVAVRKRARDPQSKMLGAAISAGLSAAAISAVTFDSLAFPTLACTQALVIGLLGALWQVVARENREADARVAAADEREPQWTR